MRDYTKHDSFRQGEYLLRGATSAGSSIEAFVDTMRNCFVRSHKGRGRIRIQPQIQYPMLTRQPLHASLVTPSMPIHPMAAVSKTKHQAQTIDVNIQK